MQSKDEFIYTNIYIDYDRDNNVEKMMNKVELNELDQDQEEFENFQLKDNVFPRGLVPLEELFDFNDVAKKTKMEPTGANVEQWNIGTEEKPKIVKLSKSLPYAKKQKYIEIFNNS